MRTLSQMRVGLLAYEMGLGKTAIAINAALRVAANGKLNPVLVICPAVAVSNWYSEFRMWDPTGHLTPYVFSYASLHKIPKNLGGLTGKTLILDEAHFLKSPSATRTRQIYGKDGLVHKANRVWALSGTPAPNNASELWTLLFTFGVTKLNYDAFVQRFCTTRAFKIGGSTRQQITGTREENIPELKTLLAPVMLRKRKSEVMNLPGILYEHVLVDASPVDLELNTSFTQYIVNKNQDDLFAQLEQEAKVLTSMMEQVGTRANDAITGLSALQAHIATLRRYTGIQKVPACIDLIKQELDRNDYDKIVIFAIHRDVIEGLRVGLAKYGAVTVYGGTPPEQRQKNVIRFQKNSKYRVFIGNIQSAGTAITLTAAHNMLFVEQSFVPGENAQAVMRCHRIGQTKPVYVRFAGIAGSIDEQVAKALKTKTKQLTLVFDEKHSTLSPYKNKDEILSEEFADIDESTDDKNLESLF